MVPSRVGFTTWQGVRASSSRDRESLVGQNEFARALSISLRRKVIVCFATVKLVRHVGPLPHSTPTQMRTKATTFGVVALWLTGVSGLGAQVSQQGSPRASAAQEFTFANVAWGSSPEKVEAAMASQALTFYRKLG